METPISHNTNRRSWPRLAGAGAGVVAVAASLVTGTAAGAATRSSDFGGASGSVAALSGSSMEVQNVSSGQTTVSWTPTTTFSRTVSEPVSSVAAGDCVTVNGTPSKSSKTTIAARSITVTTASPTGSCAPGGVAGGGFGRPGGFRDFGGGTNASGSRPSFAPPSGARRFPGGESFAFAFASGRVTGVSGSTLTLSGVTAAPGAFRHPRSPSKTSKASTKPKVKAEKLTITTSASTAVRSTQNASSNDLAVGDCVNAVGTVATNGAVTANTVRIASSSSGTCSGGLRGGFAGRFGGAPGGPGA